MSETAQDKVNRILRDHEGYTGDGKGGDGALPVGDRSTAVKPIVKRDLREALIAPLQETFDARDKAQEWAEAPEDTPVEPGQYSALHYAAKAEGSAARVDLGALDQAVSDAQDWAEGEGEPGDPGSKSAKGWAETAEIARDKAKDWAENPEDEPVGEGKYSALHHAAKAALAETGAQTAQGLAEAARDAIVDSDQIYESTSAGISGTTDQDYFWVVPSTIEGSIDLYRNESGTAVLKAAIFNFSSAMKTQDEAWSI